MKKSAKNVSKKTGRKQPKISRRAAKGLPVAFENLEIRQMMSTVNVADFGARPNDGADDRNAVIAAMNASKAGDTIKFASGTYNFSSDFNMTPDRNYTGVRGETVLKGRGGAGYLVKLQGNNVSVTNLTFDGGGFFLERNGGFNTNLTFDHNVFKLDTGGEHPSAITATSGIANTKITNNLFTGYNGGGFGIYGYNYNGLTISNNEFRNVTAGMHIDAFGNSGNLLVQQNYLVGVKGMGMEFQGTASNLKFLDNFYEAPNLSSDFNRNNNSFAFSLILDKSSNIEIKRNTVLAPQRPDGVGCRVGFEVGGDNTIVEENYINGVNHTIANNDGVGSNSVTLRNNKLMNYLQGIGGLRSSRQEGINGPTATLSWDINRARPGIDGKLSTPTDNPEPTVAPAAPTGFAAAATSGSTVNLFWNDNAYNEDGFKIERTVDGKSWTQIATIDSGKSSYKVTGLSAGTVYGFRVRAFNDGGNSSYSNASSAMPITNSKATYLSDMAWTSSKNAWGPAERDMSNGESEANDGGFITLNGKTYPKGVGTHAGSEIVVQLDGKYDTFIADLGLDDEVDSDGSVVFHVIADGKKIYESGTMTGDSVTKSIKLDVRGVNTLTLVVSTAGASMDSDHANWANARFTTVSTNPEEPPVEEPIEDGTYLSDLEWTEVTNGWGTPELDKSNGERKAGDGQTITLNGKKYDKGIGTHSNSSLTYKLDGKYTTFTADLGVDDEVGDNGSVVFIVYGDGKKLYESGTVTGAEATKSVKLDITGVQELTLSVGAAKDGKEFDHADWANAMVSGKPTKVAASSVVALSSIKSASGVNGWGKAEANMSVGDKLLGDGTKLSIGDTTYKSGIGVHSNSKLVYNLNGKYSTFKSDIGIDEEVGNYGSAIFKIYADGKLVYKSEKLTGKAQARTVEVPVSGKKQLWLVVTSAGDGANYDHADWANARLAA